MNIVGVMIRFLVGFIFVFAFFAVLPDYVLTGGASAQNGFGACDNIKSDAEAMECVRLNKEKAQADLNSLFDDFAATLDPQKLERFRIAQKEWIEYRSGQCELEASLAKSEGLQALYRLECVEKLTRQRLTHLGGIWGWSTAQTPREFGEYPKWVNVISGANPDVFWELKTAVKADLNCDGLEDTALSGLKIILPGNASKSGVQDAAKEGDETYKISLAIGIVEGAEAGSPRTILKHIDLNMNGKRPENGAKASLCAPHVDLSILPYQDADKSVSTGTITPPRKPLSLCAPVLYVQDNQCEPLVIRHKDGSYILEFRNG